MPIPDLKARMPAGILREKMILQMPVQTKTGTASSVTTYQDVDDAVWAYIKPAYGMALFYAQQFQPKANAIINIRYRPDIAAGWRLVSEDGNFKYHVWGVPIDLNHRHSVLVLHCETLQVKGV